MWTMSSAAVVVAESVRRSWSPAFTMKWVRSAGVAAVHVTEKMSLLATGANKSRAETADARTTGRHAVARAVAVGFRRVVNVSDNG